MKNIEYLIALHSIDGLGPVRLKNLLNFFKDPKLIWEASRDDLIESKLPLLLIEKILETRKNLDPNSYFESIEKSGIKIMTFFDDSYPKFLKEIYDPPLILYYKGEIKKEDEKAIGVVGTRKVTGYGKLVTEKFTKGLVAVGLTIVSGLARGVDSVAHWTAVREGGRTIAVLGGGLNNIYPPENIKLVDQIIWEKGAVMSEFPPDYPSLPGNFPARNRIISGLSKAVLVTEAAVDSGSLITARLALEQGREVFVVPGPVTSDLSRGPIDLIKEGARAVFEVADILDELNLSRIPPANLVIDLNKEEKQILEILANENLHIDELCRVLNLSSAEISAKLIKMEITGLVKNLGGGIYCKI